MSALRPRPILGPALLPLACLLISLSWACSSQVAEPEDPQPGLPNEVARQAQARIDSGFHLGTVIGIVDEQGSRYFGFGQVSPSAATVPDQHSIFEIGSITKTFTATLLADLHLRGQVDLEAEVETYVPSFSGVVVTGAGPITLESLAVHTSGLPREPSDIDAGDDDRYASYSPEQLDALLASGSVHVSPGTYAYSNFGVMLLEHAIENATGTDFESLIQDRITQQLSMPDTHLTVPDDKRARLATGFRNGQVTTEVDLGRFPSMGGIRSTATDLLTYLSAQIGLKESALSQAMAATHPARVADGDDAMGLGWHIMQRQESGKTIHYHKGGTNGFVSFAGFDLQNRRAVVVLVNGTRWFSDLGFHLLDPTYPLADPESKA